MTRKVCPWCSPYNTCSACEEKIQKENREKNMKRAMAEVPTPQQVIENGLESLREAVLKDHIPGIVAVLKIRYPDNLGPVSISMESLLSPGVKHAIAAILGERGWRTTFKDKSVESRDPREHSYTELIVEADKEIQR